MKKLRAAMLALAVLTVMFVAGCSTSAAETETQTDAEPTVIITVETPTPTKAPTNSKHVLVDEDASPEIQEYFERTYPREEDYDSKDAWAEDYVKWANEEGNPFITTVVQVPLDFEGDEYEFQTVSGVQIPITDKGYMLVKQFTRDEYVEPKEPGIAKVDVYVPLGYSGVTSDYPWTEAFDDSFGHKLVFEVPSDTEEFTVCVEYLFADMFVQNQPTGKFPEEYITDEQELYDIAATLHSVEDLDEYLSTLSYKLGAGKDDGVILPPRTDIETLRNGGGDCDELAILRISLGAKMDDPIEAYLLTGHTLKGYLNNDEDQGRHAIVQEFRNGKYVYNDVTTNVSGGSPQATFFVELMVFEYPRHIAMISTEPVFSYIVFDSTPFDIYPLN